MNHFTILTDDVDATVEFYSEFLGAFFPFLRSHNRFHESDGAHLPRITSREMEPEKAAPSADYQPHTLGVPLSLRRDSGSGEITPGAR
jgi:catechol 2,3-dioxygenase-like lactoylglutathione lyase family enzyme